MTGSDLESHARRPRFALLIVGDELLSGKRRDGHLEHVVAMLRRRGLELAWVRITGDHDADIAATVRDVRAAGDVLLSCGGIGGTPDDRTRQAVAAALDVPLVRHPDAAALIEERYAERAHPQRIRMADFPAGASLIPNPVNQVAGFSVGHCHFVPGFPEMAWPMLEWVLDTYYDAWFGQQDLTEYRVCVRGRPTEGDFVALMEEAVARFGGVRISSLPSRGRAPGQGRIEFGFSGPDAEAACEWFASQAEAVDGALVEPMEPIRG